MPTASPQLPRFTVLDGGVARDSDLERSFVETTRQGDVVGELLRAAALPRLGSRPAKARDGGPRTEAEIREAQVAAFLLGLGELRDHGEQHNVAAAMQALLSAMDAETRAWAKSRLAELDADRTTPLPPSGRRPLLAGDRRFQELRKATLDAWNALAGGFGPGVVRIGSGLPPRTQEELAGAAKSLSDALWHPSQHDVVGIARWCAAMARGLRGPQAKGQAAAAACVALVEHVEAWKRSRRGGA